MFKLNFKHLFVTLSITSCLSAAVSSAETTTGTTANDKGVYVNVNLGAFKNFSSFYNDFQFDYGGKFGVSITRFGEFSEFWAALAINRTSANPAGSIQISNLEVMVQPLFRNVHQSGFYFGPQVGFDFVGLGSNTTTEFTYGLLAGWEFTVSDNFSIGPEANLTMFSNFGQSQTALKLLMGANWML